MHKLIISLMLALGASSAAHAADASAIARGDALAKKYNCASCHGADFNKPIDASYPKLGGQHADYLSAALRAYKRGKGANGRINAVMALQVQPLSNRDMADLGAYLASLPSELEVRK